METYEIGIEILKTLIEGIDEEKYEVMVYVSAKLPLSYFCVAPIACCFQFPNDRSVYAIVRKDIAPEFDSIDFGRWFLANENICATHILLSWTDVRNVADQNAGCTLCLCSDDPNSSEWDCLKTYMILYFPGAGEAFGLDWMDG